MLFSARRTRDLTVVDGLMSGARMDLARDMVGAPNGVSTTESPDDEELDCRLWREEFGVAWSDGSEPNGREPSVEHSRRAVRERSLGDLAAEAARDPMLYDPGGDRSRGWKFPTERAWLMAGPPKPQ